MKKTYIKKFSPNTTYKEMREFEIDILGNPEKIHEDDDINIKYYSEDMVDGLIQTVHVTHTRGGHHVKIQKKKSETS